MHNEQLEHVNALLRKELAIHKERGDRLFDLVMYAYQRSSDALMTPSTKPREFRKKRDDAICDINKKLGGAVR